MRLPIYRALVFGLLMIHAGLLGWSACRHSPAGDEVAHLPAGVIHWRLRQFDLYRVNPPLVRMVAVLPVLRDIPDIDWSWQSTLPSARPEFGIGRELIRRHQERSLGWFTVARWFCIPFSLLGAYVCYRWATDLYGVYSGILALVLWCFSPNILAYGQMITPDMGAASIGVAACYLFWRWSHSPTWPDALTAGLVLGLAELTKLTWIILLPLWPVLWFLERFSTRHDGSSAKSAPQLVAMLLLAVFVINIGYGFEGTFRQLGNYQFISAALSGGDSEASFEGNRFRRTAFGALRVPLPANYVQGIDVAKRDFEIGLPSYLRGEWKHGGWWYYYLYALAVKIPLGTFCLAGCAVGVQFRTRRKGWYDCVYLLAPAFVVLILVSSQTGYNSHLRYLFPAFPFGVIYISSVMSCFSFARHRCRAAIVCASTAWTITSSLFVYPHTVSYFNELAGGPLHGHRHLLESNIDWGQDLMYLKEWLEQHPEASPLGLVCYSQIDPHSIGIKYWLPPGRQGRFAPSSRLRPGWYAISVNYLRGMTRFPVSDGHNGRIYPSGPDYAVFSKLPTVGRCGYSIYLYHVSADDIRRLRFEDSKSNEQPSR